MSHQTKTGAAAVILISYYFRYMRCGGEHTMRMALRTYDAAYLLYSYQQRSVCAARASASWLSLKGPSPNHIQFYIFCSSVFKYLI